MKVLNPTAYKDYKKDQNKDEQYYDLVDISKMGLALLDRFTPSTESRGETYTCESVVMVSGDRLVDGDGAVLGTSWMVRSLIAVDRKKQQGIVEKYDLNIITIGDQAYRLSNLSAETADPGYHLQILSGKYGKAPYEDLCHLTSVVGGRDTESDRLMEIETPSWFVSTPKLPNPFL